MPFTDAKTRKKKHKEYAKDWYERNRELTIKRSSDRRKLNKEKWIAYKSAQKCSHCGESHPAIIDFHHVIKENKQAVPQLIKHGRFTAAVREAEEKCIPLCANCHRIYHWNEIRKIVEKRRNGLER